MRAWLLRRLIASMPREGMVILIDSVTLDMHGRVSIDGHSLGMVRPGEYLLTPTGGTK